MGGTWWRRCLCLALVVAVLSANAQVGARASQEREWASEGHGISVRKGLWRGASRRLLAAACVCPSAPATECSLNNLDPGTGCTIDIVSGKVTGDIEVIEHDTLTGLKFEAITQLTGNLKVSLPPFPCPLLVRACRPAKQVDKCKEV